MVVDCAFQSMCVVKAAAKKHMFPKSVYISDGNISGDVFGELYAETKVVFCPCKCAVMMVASSASSVDLRTSSFLWCLLWQ